MTKDWKKIARASGITIPDTAFERIVPTLDSLDAEFRPLVRALPPASEPATTFHAATHQHIHAIGKDDA
jgi:hypothetical protein